ncbi:MAG TPA: M12 family metallopeptidase, partial [Abditibacteriaceae bacterium]
MTNTFQNNFGASRHPFPCRPLLCLIWMLALTWLSGGFFKAGAAAFDWNTYNGQRVKWEYNVVPYDFDRTDDATHRYPTKEEQEKFERAIRGWQKAADINFVKGANPSVNQGDYINVSASKSLVWGLIEPNFAWIGRSGGAQPMWLFNWDQHVILHEMGHALALTHEHQRSDRDTYIDCWWWNAQPGTQVNFVKTGGSDNRTAYDPYSMMHYVPYAFSLDVKNNLWTLHPKNEDWLSFIGKHNWFGEDGEIPSNGIPYAVDEDSDEFKKVGTYGYLSPLDRAGIAHEYGLPGKITGTVSNNAGGTLDLSKVKLHLKGVGNTVDTVARMKLCKETPRNSDAAGNYEFIGLPSGTYTVKPVMANYRFTPPTQTVVATSGNITTASFTAILDEAAPPVVNLLTPDNSTPAYKIRPKMLGTADDGVGGSGVANVGVALSDHEGKFLNWSSGSFDSTSFSAAHRSVINNGSFSWEFTIPSNISLPDGWYQFHANALDNSGNDSEYTTHSFYLDNGAPSVAFAPLVNEQNVLDFGLVGGTVSDTLSPVTTQISIREDNGGGAADRQWNGSTWVTGSASIMLAGRVDGNNWKPAFTLPTRTQISDRGFYIYVKAIDKAGNFNGATIHLHRIPTDSTVPDLSITSPTHNKVLTTNSIGPISGVARDQQTGLSEVTIYLMRLKTGGGFETWNGTAWTDTQNPLPTAIDHATGNWTAPATSNEFTYSLPSGANLRNGQYQLQAYAKNNETPRGTRGVSVSFTVDFHQEYTWTGATMRDTDPNNNSDHWGTAANWSPVGVPDVNDIAFIGNGDTVRSTISRTVHGFYLSNGALDFDNATDSLNVTKKGTWSGGTLRDTININAGATFAISTINRKTLDSGATLNNNGTINWAAGSNNEGGSIHTYAYQTYERSTINNRSGGVFNLTTDGTPFTREHQRSFFNNLAGAKIIKTGGAGSAVINAFAVDNAGEVRSNSGVIELATDLSLSGPTTFAGTGKILLSGTTTASAAITASCPVDLTGVLTGSFHPTTYAPLSSYGGSGVLSWKAGTISGAWTINAGATMSLSGADAKILFSGAILNNSGTINWAAGPNNAGGAIHTYAYQTYERSTINNRSGGVFNLTTDGTPFTREHQRSFFNNLAGAKIIKTGGAGSAVINAFELANSGEVRSNTGALSYNTVINVLAGSTFTGTGAHQMTDGSFNLNGNTTLVGTSFTVAGGTIRGNGGTLATSGIGALNWTGGSLDGIFNFAANSTMNLSGATTKVLVSGATLNNNGTINWAGGPNNTGSIHTYAYQTYERSTINNRAGANFNVTTGGTVFTKEHNPSFFNNEVGAKFNKTGAGVSTDNNFAFNNKGLARVFAGTYAWNAGGNSTGVFQADSGALLRLTGGTNAVVDTQLTGAGRVQIDGATVTGGGALTNSMTSTGGLDLISGTLNGTTNYTGAGLLNWSGGSLGGTFTLAAGSTINVLGAARKTLVSGATLNNNGTINWAAGPNNAGGDIFTSAYQTYERSTINNRSGANFNLTTDGTPFSKEYNYSLFNNLAGGKLNKTGGAGDTVINSFAVNNAGEVRSNSGVLDFAAPLDVTGPTTFAGTAKIRLSHVATAAAPITSTCSVELTGVLTGNIHPTTYAPLSSYGGSGVLSWKSGTISGVWTQNAGATMSLSGTDRKTLALGATLNNSGTINWAAGPDNTGSIFTSAYQSYDRSTINNRSGGVFNLTTDGTPFTREHQRSFFNNLAGGKLIKTGGTATTTIDAFELANNGEVRSNSGVLAYNTVLNANNGGTFSGAGKHLMTAGSFNVRGTSTVNGPVFEISGGTVEGDSATLGTLAGVGSGIWNWTGGTISGVLRIGANTNLLIDGATRKTLAMGATLDNYGIVSFTGGDIYTYAYQTYERSTVLNHSGGTFKLMGGTWSRDHQRSFFQNDGTLEIGAQLGIATLDRDFTQSSTGKLNIQIGGANAATPQFDQLQIGGGATLAGALNVSLVNGYTAPAGASFKVLTFGSRSSAFSTVSSPFIGTYNPNDLTLTRDLTVPASVAVTNPANGSGLKAVTSISGTATDNAGGSGIGKVEAYLRRTVSGAYQYWALRSGTWGWGASV